MEITMDGTYGVYNEYGHLMMRFSKLSGALEYKRKMEAMIDVKLNIVIEYHIVDTA
jgi:hypothetical protein